MSKKTRSPIFAHSLFRSGSTYFFNVFRRAAADNGEKLYTAFQEPIHEAVIDAATNPSSLNFFSGVGAIPKTLRHPEIGASYFAEMIEIATAWAPFADPEIVYDGYFGGAAEAKTVGFMNSLINAAPRRPVICDCRTAARIGVLRRELGGIHIYLWRNPWDQWWSLKATDYFDSINQLIASVSHAPEPLRRLATEIGIRQPAGAATKERMEFFNERRLTAEHSYQLHFMLWVLALDSGTSAADFDVNIDKLSEDDSYRNAIAEKFQAVGALGLDFSDAAIPRSAFGEDDAVFFSPLEMRVRAILLESGWSAAQIEAVDTIRRLNAPQTMDERGEGRLREVMRRTETRDAGIARKFEHEAAAANIDAENFRAIAKNVHEAIAEAVNAVRAEASDNRVRLDAIITDARGEIARLSGANAESTQSLEAERAEHARAAGALAEINAEYQNAKAALAGEIELHAQTRTALRQASEAATSAAGDNVQLKAALDDEAVRHSQARAELAQATEAAAAAVAEAARLAAMHEGDARQLAAVRAELESETARTRDALWEAKRNALHADDLEHRLAALYASTSWKATAPLRAVSLSSRAAFAVLKTAAKAVARPPLALALRAVRLAPPLKRLLLRSARANPAIGNPFLNFALARPPEGGFDHGQTFAAPTARKKIATRVARRSPAPQRRASAPALYYYVDHTIECPVNTGVQRVVRGLAVGLLSHGAPLVFVRWSRELKQLVRVDCDALAHLARWSGPDADAGAYPTRGEAERLIPVHSPDDDSWLIVPEVTHINAEGDNPTLDIIMAAKQAKLRTAFVFYDAIPLRRPEFSQSAQRHESYMRALLLADLVAPISAWSGRDLASFFVHHEKSNLEGGPRISPLLLPFASTVKDHSQNIRPREHLILSVGTIELRKNQGALIEAFESFEARHPAGGWRLELIGNLHSNMAETVKAAEKRNPRISHRANISDEDLADLYDRAAFTVFPSVEEGFGLPIVESLAHDAPCICANFGAMAELARGGGCLAIDTRDPAMICDAIEALATDPQHRAALAAEAAERPQTTWADYAGNFLGEMAANSSPFTKLGRIYYCIHSTAAVPFNTGIQRTVRSLAKALIDEGCSLIPVKWDNVRRKLTEATDEDLAHLAKWNGPPADSWTIDDPEGPFGSQDWLLSAELLLNPGDVDSFAIEEWTKRANLRTTWIFYDVIPWKLRGRYDPAFSDFHTGYLIGLRTANLILAISHYSAAEFELFLDSTGTRVPTRELVVRPIQLPGELKERRRSFTPKPPADDGVRRLLCVCSIESRKNHLALLDAIQMAKPLSKRRLELWLVGRAAPEPELIAEVERRVGADPALHWEREADDGRLAELYEMCDFTVYPSLEEGFGLPILESLWAARPCICRNEGAMREVADGGGCLMVETQNPEEIRDAIVALANNDTLLSRLGREAAGRPFRTWRDYAHDVATALADERASRQMGYAGTLIAPNALSTEFVSLAKRPKLSICVTTYNRAEWLRVCLLNLARLVPEPREEIELLVVDNASADHTPEIVEPYVRRSDFRSIRNPENVGMLGNLRVTADAARGEYIWIIGDDDLPAPGSIEAILAAIDGNDNPALIYLNYGYTREDDPLKITDLDAYLASSTPISPPSADFAGPIAALATKNENFFTAIYCLVFRRDHALRAYAQDTSGRPFSTMRTCIPTTYHVLHHMMHEKGAWLGKPQIIVNMNVSWMKYAPIWILERIPEVFDIAEKKGAPIDEIDGQRRNHLLQVHHWFHEILKDDPEGNRAYFDPRRLFARFKHLAEFRAMAGELAAAYAAARDADPEAFPVPVEEFRLDPVPAFRDAASF